MLYTKLTWELGFTDLKAETYDVNKRPEATDAKTRSRPLSFLSVFSTPSGLNKVCYKSQGLLLVSEVVNVIDFNMYSFS